ncbi:preQ(1) synthase [Prochlorococcus sp. MIT 1223]|uniref:preQ(1) synthase n=1 Tax=Prochlorococcus sp. MIT 1223 TaxID=3096217 RepID=UPI002A75FDD2|nr:preQ(1) synthase [Prochlorococcus sp. MIT 1223]
MHEQSETQSPLYGERAIAGSELICFENPNQQRSYEISIDLPEFTCQCPFSGYPDFAVLRLLYQPGPKVLELKSIKLYINSYRNKKISHEEVANRILDDLVNACNPNWMQLEADFNPRGNVHMLVKVSHGNRREY